MYNGIIITFIFFGKLLTTGVLLLSEVLTASWEPLCRSLSTLQEPSQRSRYFSRGSRVYDRGHCDYGGCWLYGGHGRHGGEGRHCSDSGHSGHDSGHS